MSDPVLTGASQVLLREMGLNDGAIERRKRIVGIEPADVTRIGTIRDVVVPNVEQYTEVFFNHLAALDEARPLLSSRALADHARQLKKEHLIGLASGDYGAKYVEQRLQLGLVYAKAGLDTRVFLGAFHHVLKSI